MTETFSPSRRAILTGTGALVIGTFLPMKVRAQNSPQKFSTEPNAFLRIAPDNTVTILSKHIEFGQGPWTGLATLIAEEMDADWSQMRAEHSPANNQIYANTLFGMQATGGSTAIANSYMQMRKVGAAARHMLVMAAAEEWKVKPGLIKVEKGTLSYSNNSATFGQFAAAAAKQTAPEDPRLKDRKDFKLIGTDIPKLDTKPKTDGTAQFTMDVYRDNMLTVVVAHSPAFGGKVASFDDSKARAVKGVVDVKQIPQGVAVYAENTFAALKGRKALKTKWDDTAAETRSTPELKKLFVNAVQKTGLESKNSGDVDKALEGAENILEAEYFFPFLAHAPMEPLDALIEKNGDKVDIWMGAQFPAGDEMAIAKTLGVDLKNTKLKTMLAGGSFGRRATAGSDFAIEVAEAFKATDMSRPLKLMWTREDDIRGGFYRPMTAHKVRAAMDKDGNILGWDHVIASQSLTKGTPFDSGQPLDQSMLEGAKDMYYNAPNHRLTGHMVDLKIPVLWWRSVGHTHTGYVMETMIDQLLEMNGIDAVEGRLKLLKDPREKAVLKRAAEIAKWGRKPAAGRQLGVAVHKSFNTYVAQIAETSIKNGKPHVHKVWAAVDCGQAVNTNVIKAQIEGGIGYGLGAVLFDEITIGKGGHVEQSNFHDYRSLRIHEMPDVEVSIIDSSESPTGVGEPGVPPAAPAMANALRRLSGKAHYNLPIVGLYDPVGA